MKRVKVICAEPGEFHERFGRTVLAAFVKAPISQMQPTIFDWHEEPAWHGTAQPKHAGSQVLRNDAGHSRMRRIKRPATTSMGAGNKPAKKRTVGYPHVDLRCRGCGLARRMRGEALWPILDAALAQGRDRVSLRDIITELGDSPTT